MRERQSNNGASRIAVKCGYANKALMAATILLAGCASAPPDVADVRDSHTANPAKETGATATPEAVPDPGPMTPERVLALLGQFLNDERLTVSELTRQLIGQDIPVRPHRGAEHISSGGIVLWEQNKGLWYFAAHRRTFKPASRDGFVEELSIAMDPSKTCTRRMAVDQALKVPPRVRKPEFNELWHSGSLKFTREQLTDPGWVVYYEAPGRKVWFDFSFKECASRFEVYSK